MNYIGNDIYEIELNGQIVQCSAEQLREAFIDIKNYEKEPVNDYIEECPSNYIYEDSARYELLRTEVQDKAYENLEWNDDLEDVLDVAIECAMSTAHNWYTGKYHMEAKI
jgi:hypothetical protein